MRAQPATADTGVGRYGFTIVELIVVVTVIVLILAFAVPGISAMNAEARLTTAQQTIHSAMTQAYNLALANRTPAALRLLPAEWDVQPDSQAAGRECRQALSIYTYVGTNVSESGSNFVLGPKEYFQRAKEFNSSLMPEDIWAAPLEALAPGGTLAHSDGTIEWLDAANWRDFWLTGRTDAPKFAFDADKYSVNSDPNFLGADDFLIVCDPRTGLWSGMARPVLLKAYAPPDRDWYDIPEATPDPNSVVGPPYQRYSFTGVVTYRREAFATLAGTTNLAQARQDLLRQSGRAYAVQRFGGGLVPVLQRPQ